MIKMLNIFTQGKALKKGESTTPNAHHSEQALLPLPYYSWGKDAHSDRFLEQSDLWDAQQQVKADPNSAEKQEILADSFMVRSQAKPDASPAFELESALTSAISSTSPDQPERLLRRESKLAVFYERRYVLKGKMDDLKAGIALATRVAEGTPDSDMAKPHRLTCLSNLLAHRFEWKGNPHDMNKAVAFAAAAVDLAGPFMRNAGNPDGISRLTRNLSGKLELRSKYTGSLSDLEQAIEEAERALELMSGHNPDRLPYIGEVGNMRARKFQKSQDIDDLKGGIAAMERAVVAATGNAELPRLHDNMANAYFAWYESNGSKPALKLAIERADEARRVQSRLAQSHPDMGRYLSSLAQKYAARAQANKRHPRWAFLAERFAKSALKRLPEEHPDRAEALECLADVKVLAYGREPRIRPEVREEARRLLQEEVHRRNRRALRSQVTITMELVETPSHNMHNAVSTYLDAARQVNSHPFTCIRACSKLGDMKMTNMEFEDAANAYEKAIALWPRLNPRTLVRDDMEYVISKLSGLGALAAICIYRSNARRSTSDALQALESGRGIIASLTIEASDLRKEHTDLHQRYTDMCHAISSPLMPPTANNKKVPKASIAAAIARRNQEFQDLDQLEREIRSLPGFEKFPHTQSIIEFTELAGRGPIVCFSTTGDITIAFLVTTRGVEIIFLDKISYEDLRGHVEFLVRGKSPSKVRKSKKAENNELVRKTLKWLWTCAVEPVLRHLNLIKNIPPKTLPRIWWVTSGLLGLLPLHAAGTGWGTSRNNTMSHVVSSYAPTFKALAYVRQKQLRRLGDPGTKFLVVRAPERKGCKPLDPNQTELEGVLKNFGPDMVKESLPSSPSPEEVLENLKTANIAHFICHGISEAHNPSRGGLQLRDGQDGRLTIHDLASCSLDQVQIAYLSACSTAQNKTNDLVDESIHVASAFNLVGFTHVIGTLWEASDEIAAMVAPTFYKVLSGKIQEELSDNDAVAYALHEAVISLWRKNGKIEKKKRDRVDNWVPFIHIGA
jgi:tetratricopeptide (TPR) repeat protein